MNRQTEGRKDGRMDNRIYQSLMGFNRILLIVTEINLISQDLKDKELLSRKCLVIQCCMQKHAFCQ